MEILIGSAQVPEPQDYLKAFDVLKTYNILCGEMITYEDIIDIISEDGKQYITQELVDTVRGTTSPEKNQEINMDELA